GLWLFRRQAGFQWFSAKDWYVQLPYSLQQAHILRHDFGIAAPQAWKNRPRVPFRSRVEMAHTLKGVEGRLNAHARYREEFAKAFGPGRITYDTVAKAIASFERTVQALPSTTGKYGHDEKAGSASVKCGFVVFTSPKKGNCAACHRVGEDY